MCIFLCNSYFIYFRATKHSRENKRLRGTCHWRHPLHFGTVVVYCGILRGMCFVSYVVLLFTASYSYRLLTWELPLCWFDYISSEDCKCYNFNSIFLSLKVHFRTVMSLLEVKEASGATQIGLLCGGWCCLHSLFSRPLMYTSYIGICYPSPITSLCMSSESLTPFVLRIPHSGSSLGNSS